MTDPTTTPVSTRATDRAIRLADRAGLRPQWRDPYGNSRAISLDGTGIDSAFGTIHVGLRSGRILRGSLTFGNTGPTHKYEGAQQVIDALAILADDPAAQPTPGSKPTPRRHTSAPTLPSPGPDTLER